MKSASIQIEAGCERLLPDQPASAWRSDPITRALLVCGLVAPLALITFFVWASAVTPGYSYIANSISQLAAQGQPHPEIMGAGFVVFGLLINAFAHGLYRTLPHRESTAVWATLSVYGTAMVLTGFFQDYAISPKAARNVAGFAHSLFAQIAVLGLMVGIVLIARIAHQQPGWHHLTALSIVTAAAVAVTGLLFLLLPGSIQGLPQRALYLITLIWIAGVAVTALRRRSVQAFVNKTVPWRDSIAGDRRQGGA